MVGKKGIPHPWNKDKKGTFKDGHKQSKTTKMKQSKTVKEKYKNGYINPFKNKKHTDKTKEKISEKHWSKNPKYREKVLAILKMPVEQEIKDKISATLYKDSSSNYRKKALKNFKHKCVKCKVTNLKILVVHHKDRNRENNNLDNLEFLCRNCHFLEHVEEWRKSRK